MRVMLRGYGLQIVYRASRSDGRACGPHFHHDFAARPLRLHQVQAGKRQRAADFLIF